MKQLARLATLGLLGLAGCVTQSPLTIAPMRDASSSSAPLRAEQVTAENAHRLSQALPDELDREAQHEISTGYKQ